MHSKQKSKSQSKPSKLSLNININNPSIPEPQNNDYNDGGSNVLVFCQSMFGICQRNCDEHDGYRKGDGDWKGKGKLGDNGGKVGWKNGLVQKRSDVYVSGQHIQSALQHSQIMKLTTNHINHNPKTSPTAQTQPQTHTPIPKTNKPLNFLTTITNQKNLTKIFHNITSPNHNHTPIHNHTPLNLNQNISKTITNNKQSKLKRSESAKHGNEMQRICVYFRGETGRNLGQIDCADFGRKAKGKIRCRSVKQFINANKHTYEQLKVTKDNQVHAHPTLPNNNTISLKSKDIKQRYLKPTLKQKPQITPTPEFPKPQHPKPNPYKHTIIPKSPPTSPISVPSPSPSPSPSYPPLLPQPPIQSLNVNNMRVDPVQLYQIKNVLNEEEYKYVSDENPLENTYNFSSHFIISKGQLYLKESEFKKEDQVKIDSSYQSFISSSNFCSNYNAISDAVISVDGKKFKSKPPQKSKYPISSIANLQNHDNETQINDEFQKDKDTEKDKQKQKDKDPERERDKERERDRDRDRDRSICLEDQRKLIRGSNQEQTKNNGILLESFGVKLDSKTCGLVPARQCSDSKLKTIITPVDIQKNRQAKQKIFSKALQQRQFSVILWAQKPKAIINDHKDQQLSSSFNGYTNTNTRNHRYRRQMFIGLCNKIEIYKERGIKTNNPTEDIYNFEKIMSEAQRKQRIRKQSLLLKFQIITDSSCPTNLQNSTNFLHFQLQIKRNDNPNNGKIEYYKQKMFNSCIDCNVEEFVKNLNKFIQLLVVARSKNGVKLLLAREFGGKRNNALVYNRRVKYLSSNCQLKRGNQGPNWSREKRVQIQTKDNKEWMVEDDPINTNHRSCNTKEVGKGNAQISCVKSEDKKRLSEFERECGIENEIRHKGFITICNKYFLYQLKYALISSDPCSPTSPTSLLNHPNHPNHPKIPQKQLHIKLEIIHQILNQTANLPVGLPDEDMPVSYNCRGMEILGKNQRGLFLEEVFYLGELLAVRGVREHGGGGIDQFVVQEDMENSTIETGLLKYLQKQLNPAFTNHLAQKLIQSKIFGIKPQPSPLSQMHPHPCPSIPKLKKIECEQHKTKIDQQQQLPFHHKLRKNDRKCRLTQQKQQQRQKQNFSNSKLSSSLDLTRIKNRNRSRDKEEIQHSLREFNVGDVVASVRGRFRSFYYLTERNRDDQDNCRKERKLKINAQKASNSKKCILGQGYVVLNMKSNFIFGHYQNKSVYRKLSEAEQTRALQVMQHLRDHRQTKLHQKTTQILCPKPTPQIFHKFFWFSPKVSHHPNSNPNRLSILHTSQLNTSQVKTLKIVSSSKTKRKLGSRNWNGTEEVEAVERLMATCFVECEDVKEKGEGKEGGEDDSGKRKRLDRFWVKLIITPVRSSRFYIVKVNGEDIIATQVNSLQKQHSQPIQTLTSSQTPSPNNLFLLQPQQLQTYTKKLRKYKTLVSYQYRTKPPLYKIFYRKTKKLCVGMYTIFTIVHTPSMNCGFVRVYANWIQKKFYFKLQAERFQRNWSRSGNGVGGGVGGGCGSRGGIGEEDELGQKYWEEIVQYLAKLLRNVYFKTKVEEITEKVHVKNMKIYNMIMRKGMENSKIRVFADTRAGKYRKKQLDQSAQRQNNRLLSQSETVMYQDIIHHYTSNLTGTEFLILLYKQYPRPAPTPPQTNPKKPPKQKPHPHPPPSSTPTPEPTPNPNLQIQLYQQNRLHKLKFDYKPSLRIRSKPLTQKNEIEQDILMELITKSLTSPLMFYKSILNQLKECIRDPWVRDWFNLVRRVKGCLGLEGQGQGDREGKIGVDRKQVEKEREQGLGKKGEKESVLSLLDYLVSPQKEKEKKRIKQQEKEKYRHIVQFRKHVNGTWLSILTYPNLPPRTKKLLILPNPCVQKPQSPQNLGFQSCIPIQNYNRRLMKRLAQTYR